MNNSGSHKPPPSSNSGGNSQPAESATSTTATSGKQQQQSAGDNSGINQEAAKESEPPSQAKKTTNESREEQSETGFITKTSPQRNNNLKRGEAPSHSPKSSLTREARKQKQTNAKENDPNYNRFDALGKEMARMEAEMTTMIKTW